MTKKKCAEKLPGARAIEEDSSPVLPGSAEAEQSPRTLVPLETPKRRPKPAREAIAEVFEALGGVEAMVDWVESDEANRKLFYSSVYPRLIPLKPSNVDQPAVRELIVRFV